MAANKKCLKGYRGERHRSLCQQWRFVVQTKYYLPEKLFADTAAVDGRENKVYTENNDIHNKVEPNLWHTKTTSLMLLKIPKSYIYVALPSVILIEKRVTKSLQT